MQALEAIGKVIHTGSQNWLSFSIVQPYDWGWHLLLTQMIGAPDPSLIHSVLQVLQFCSVLAYGSLAAG